MVEEREDSYYSEGELLSRDKLVAKKSYSAPYIVISDNYDQPLYDSQDEEELESANTTTLLKNLEMQEQMMEAMQGRDSGQDGEEQLDEETDQLLMMQQQFQQQNQNQKQHSKITEVSKSKESSQQNMKQRQNNQSTEHKRQSQQYEQQL